MNPETLLRETFQHLADQAPDADTVQREVLRRAHDRRRRPFVLRTPVLAVAAAGLTAVAVLAVNGALGGAATVTAAPGAAASQSVAAAPPVATSPTAFVEAPLLLSPQAIPASLRETGRTLQVGPGGISAATLTRTWQPAGPADPSGGNRLELILWHRSVEVGESTAVSVGGTVGRWVAGADKSLLTWSVAPGVEAQLLQIGLGLDQAALLRIATSLRADERTARFPIAIGTTPQSGTSTEQGFEVSVDDDGSWVLSASRADSVRVEVSSAAPARPAGATELTVDGRPAYYLADEGGASLFVVLDGGTGLWVRSAARPAADPATLVRLAKAVTWQAPEPL